MQIKDNSYMENNNNVKFRILNLNRMDSKPTFKEAKNGDYIEYGSDNAYPQYLLDVFHNKSNKHKAIISKKVDMTTGSGFKGLESDSATSFVENRYGKDDLDYVAKRVNFDYEIHSGFAMFIRWNSSGTKIAAIDWLPYHKCRLSSDEKSILVSKDWTNIRKKVNKPVTYPRFNPMASDKEPTQVFYYVEESNGVDYYPLPYYSSTLNWIELDWEISTFHLSSVRNGFSAGFILNFATGIPTEEEMDLAYKAFNRKYTGSNNAGKFILTYSEGQDQKPDLTPIELNSSDERFMLLHSEMLTEILIGHSVTSPMLFGVRTEGQLGGRNEILEALAIFQSTYIDNKQKTIEKAFNKLAKYSDVTEKLELGKYTIDFSNIENS